MYTRLGLTARYLSEISLDWTRTVSDLAQLDLL